MVSAKAVGSTTITVKANDGSGVKATCNVSVKSSVPDKSPSGAKAVDLGLSIKWANMNVGATEVTGYGDYFAWGETTPKATYTKENYKYYTTTSYVDSDGFSVTKSGYIKYISKNNSSKYGWDGFYDNKEVLDKEDDAAYIIWGGNWRMPTREELNELISKCTWNWTTYNGVNGYKVTGPNGNYIFFPATGYRYGSVLGFYSDGLGYGSILDNAGSSGLYWSSSLCSSDPYYACNLGSNSSYVTLSDYGDRLDGRSVRPVCP